MFEYPYGQSLYLPPFPHVSLDGRVRIDLVVGFHGLVAVGTSSDRVIRASRVY